MIQNNAKYLLDNTVILYKQTASSRHDVCLDQRSFKCKIGKNCSNILFISGSHQRRMLRFKSASRAPSFLFTFSKISRSPR